MAHKIKLAKDKHPQTNNDRVIVFEGIQYLSYSLESAELVWLEYPSTTTGEPIEGDLVVPRRIIVPISNSVTVNNQGVIITKEFIKSQNAKTGKEDDEVYEARLETLYNTAISTGKKQFDHWMEAIKWDKLVKDMGTLWQTSKRFDRK